MIEHHRTDRRVSGAAAVAAALIALTAVPAAADMTKAECIEANAKGQDLRRDGKLSAAREQLRRCADPSCAGMVRDDCTRRLDEIERVQPTIVFDAKDYQGHDVSAVAVTVDGKPLASRLTGAALEVDPGEHVFVFTVAGQPPLTQSFVIKESERDRRERIVFPAPAPATSAAAQPAASSGGGMGTGEILGLTAAAVGVAGIAAGSVFGLLAISQKNQQTSDCPSSGLCPNPAGAASDHSNAVTYGTISTAGFIAGGVLLAAGGALFFLSGGSHEPASPAGLAVAPSVGSAGGGVLVAGRF